MGLAILIPNADFSESNLGKVTVAENINVSSISIDAPTSIQGESYTLGVSYYPQNTNQRNVTWSIVSGNEYASINASSGKLTINQNADNSSITVKAVSTSNQSVFATKNIQLTYELHEDDVILSKTLNAFEKYDTSYNFASSDTNTLIVVSFKVLGNSSNNSSNSILCENIQSTDPWPGWVLKVNNDTREVVFAGLAQNTLFTAELNTLYKVYIKINGLQASISTNEGASYSVYGFNSAANQVFKIGAVTQNCNIYCKVYSSSSSTPR